MPESLKENGIETWYKIIDVICNKYKPLGCKGCTVSKLLAEADELLE